MSRLSPTMSRGTSVPSTLHRASTTRRSRPWDPGSAPCRLGPRRRHRPPPAPRLARRLLGEGAVGATTGRRVGGARRPCEQAENAEPEAERLQIPPPRLLRCPAPPEAQGITLKSVLVDGPTGVARAGRIGRVQGRERGEQRGHGRGGADSVRRVRLRPQIQTHCPRRPWRSTSLEEFPSTEACVFEYAINATASAQGQGMRVARSLLPSVRERVGGGVPPRRRNPR